MIARVKTPSIPAHAVPDADECERRRQAMRAYIHGLLLWLRCVPWDKRDDVIASLRRRLYTKGWQGGTARSAIRHMLAVRCTVCGCPLPPPDMGPPRFIRCMKNEWPAQCQAECVAAANGCRGGHLPSPAEIAEECRRIRAGEVEGIKARRL